MTGTYISFYLKVDRIYVFVEALRAIGSPKRICFMISDDGNKLILAPYSKTDLKSHMVSREVYNGSGCMSIGSKKLCSILAAHLSWDKDVSYRVTGRIDTRQNIIVFDLTSAKII